MPDEIKPLPARGVEVLIEIIGQLSDARDSDAASFRRDLEAREAEVLALRGRYERASHESENRLGEIRTLAQRVRELEDQLDHDDLRIAVRSLQSHLGEAQRRCETLMMDRDAWKTAEAVKEATLQGERAENRDAIVSLNRSLDERSATMRAEAQQHREAEDALKAERDSLAAELELMKADDARTALAAARQALSEASRDVALWHGRHREAVILADEIHQAATRRLRVLADIRKLLDDANEDTFTTVEEGL